MKAIFAGYSSLGSKFFLLTLLNKDAIPLSSEIAIVSDEKAMMIQIIVLLYVVCCFSLATFKIFSYLWFIAFVTWLGEIFFILLFGVHWAY